MAVLRKNYSRIPVEAQPLPITIMKPNGSPNNNSDAHGIMQQKAIRRLFPKSRLYGMGLSLALLLYSLTTMNLVTVPDTTLVFGTRNTSEANSPPVAQPQQEKFDALLAKRNELAQKIQAARTAAQQRQAAGAHLPPAPSDAKTTPAAAKAAAASVVSVARLAVQQRALATVTDFERSSLATTVDQQIGVNTTGLTHWETALVTKQQAMASLHTPVLVLPDAPLQLLRLHDYKKEQERIKLQQQQANSTALSGAAAATPASSNNSNSTTKAKPMMAIITSTRSTANHTQTKDSLLVKHLVQSVLKTVSVAEREHWNVHLYVAVDDTDLWWLHERWHQMDVAAWLKVTFGVFPDRGHHIPFNEIALVAYKEGADYFCRVNDDTEFKTNEWITKAVAVLQSYNPPNMGVVGPKCGQGNTQIMTHDMVHRTHMEIFQGNYYPPAFGNWFLDDWISFVYSDLVLGPKFHHVTVLNTWIVKHWVYTTRYSPNIADAQWLPVEYEHGRRRIAAYIQEKYPNRPANAAVAASLPAPKRVNPRLIEAVLKVLPPDGNLLVWGLNMDSHFWHGATTGRVVFLEDQSTKKRFQKRWIWRDFVRKSYPYLEYFLVTYTTARGAAEDNFQRYVAGQNLENSHNWCDLELAAFPDSVRETVWDVVLVEAPEDCSTLDACQDNDGPGVFQPLYMTKVLVANQTGRAFNASLTDRLTHVFVDDYERKYEREFSESLFVKKPDDVIQKSIVSDKVVKEHAHFVINVNDRIAQNIPYCRRPPIREVTTFPKDAEMDAKQVNAILNALPRDGNLLIWGLGPESIFWHHATWGRVIFLEDNAKDLMEDGKTSYFEHITTKHPELEAYRVNYSTENNDQFYNRFSGHPERWASLEMNETTHNLPSVLREIAWDVILVDAPLGCCNAGPGRLQSLYMTKVLANNSQTLVKAVNDTSSSPSSGVVTHVFVDDYDRKLEQEFSKQVFDKSPIAVVKRGKTSQCAHFVLEKSDFIRVRSIEVTPAARSNLAADTNSKRVIRDRTAFPKEAQMGWAQVETILAALPSDGNLLVWGLGNDSPFWSQTTSGKVVFLEDGSWSTNLLNGKRWFDQITAANPQLEAYAVDYTTTNSKASYDRFSGHPESWSSLEMKSFPKVVMETRWDVILVDAPLGYPNTGPGRYQSLYMTKLLAKSSEATARSSQLTGAAVHVFVDDYERKVEREFSQQMFGRAPVKVVKREARPDVPANEQAYFVFGLAAVATDLDETTSLTGSSTLTTNANAKEVVRDKSAFPKEAQMGWDQVKNILAALPSDGNLLVWGLGNDSLFWSQTTSGKVVFLEDGSWSTNLLNGKRWFDQITAANPQLEAYAVNYTTTNSEASYNRFSGHPESWSSLEMDNFPKVVMETRWDVILVDAPLGYPGAGPGRYQSLYMTNLLANSSEAMARPIDSQSTSSAVHVFVDDYERKVEKEFSQQVFGKSPVKVVKRVARPNVAANLLAHFIFGQAEVNDEDDDSVVSETSILVPWKNHETVEAHESSPLSAPESWVILLEVNNGYYDFFLNWLFHYNMLDIAIDVVVIAEDDAVKEKLEKEVLPVSSNVRVERSGLTLGTSSVKYGTKAYKTMVSARATHILQKLEEGIHVIYTDVDTVWRSNPLPYLATAGEVDAILLVDTDTFNGVSPYYCTGFMAFVSNDRTIQLMSDWQDALKTAQLNQPIFNHILHNKSVVKHQPLPKAEFPSGESYFKKFKDGQRAKVVVVHNNYIQGSVAKMQRFKGHGLWKVAEQQQQLLSRG